MITIPHLVHIATPEPESRGQNRTSRRRKAFTDDTLTRCEETTREVCAGFEASLKQFNGEHDHVRLLVHYPPKVQLSKLVNSLKQVSARLLRKEYDAHVRRYVWGGRF